MRRGGNALIALEWPDRAAYVMASSGKALTYRELDEASNQLAQWFRSVGLQRGDHIALLLENHERFFVVAWAAQRSGLYWTTLSTRLTAEEASYIIGDCGARVFFTSSQQERVAQGLVDLTPAVEHRITLDTAMPGYAPLADVMADQPVTPIADECEGADMLYSSGTTGRPKGILVPLPPPEVRGLAPIARMVKDLYGFDENTIYLSPAPLYHAAPLRFSMGTHQLGGTVVVLDRFDPLAALAAIETHRVTHSQWVPTMFVRMLKLSPEDRNRYDLSSHRVALHAAAPCPAEVKEQMIEWWGPILHEYYGGTEANGFVYCNSHEWLAHRGTVGRLLIGTIHICDEDGKEVPVGESGTIWFEGTPSFEYHGDDEQTKSSRHPSGNGWTTLGDIGHVDEDGFLYLTDRRAFTIVAGGVNIYPREAEDVLILHPAVADVAVFGVPNEDLGEEVKAVVQPVAPDLADDALADELLAWCRDRLSHVKCPRSIDFRPELPRDANGKLYKRPLRDEYWGDRKTRIGR